MKKYQVFMRHEHDYIVEAESIEEAEAIAIDEWYEQVKSSDYPEVEDICECD